MRGEFGHRTGPASGHFSIREARPRRLRRDTTGPSPGENPEPVRELHLTKRQAEILALAASGLSDKAIAARLGLTIPTIRSHMQRLYKAYGIHTRTGAV